jgi:hypothetical protein
MRAERGRGCPEADGAEVEEAVAAAVPPPAAVAAAVAPAAGAGAGVMRAMGRRVLRCSWESGAGLGARVVTSACGLWHVWQDASGSWGLLRRLGPHPCPVSKAIPPVACWWGGEMRNTGCCAGGSAGVCGVAAMWMWQPTAGSRSCSPSCCRAAGTAAPHPAVPGRAGPCRAVPGRAGPCRAAAPPHWEFAGREPPPLGTRCQLRRHRRPPHPPPPPPPPRAPPPPPPPRAPPPPPPTGAAAYNFLVPFVI